MIFTDILLGTIIGAILWPIVQQVVDSANRAVLGLILGGLVGGALSWAKLGLYAGLIIGASLGANVTPFDENLGLIFLDALFQTGRGAAIGAIVVLSIRSISFVLTGAGIGLLTSLFLSVGLRLINRSILTNPLTSTQMTLIVIFGCLIVFGVRASRN